MLRITYRPDGGSHCRVEVRGVLCKNVYPLSEGCVCVCPPLSGSFITRRTAFRIKIRLRLFGQWLCSGVFFFVCRCEGLAFLIYIFVFLLLGPEFCRPLVVYVRVRMFNLRTLGLGISKGFSGRTHIHLVWRTWQFRGGVFVSWLFRTGFFALKRQMTTQGLSSDLVESLPLIFLRCMIFWVMCTTYTSLQTAWFWWLWRCRWMHRVCR